jgi:hypothetical protein
VIARTGGLTKKTEKMVERKKITEERRADNLFEFEFFISGTLSAKKNIGHNGPSHV